MQKSIAYCLINFWLQKKRRPPPLVFLPWYSVSHIKPVFFCWAVCARCMNAMKIQFSLFLGLYNVPWKYLTIPKKNFISQTWLWSLVAPQVRGFCARLRLTVVAFVLGRASQSWQLCLVVWFCCEKQLWKMSENIVNNAWTHEWTD